MFYTVQIKAIKRKNKNKIKTLSKIMRIDCEEVEELVTDNQIVLLNVDEKDISNVLDKLSNADIKYNVSMPIE